MSERIPSKFSRFSRRDFLKLSGFAGTGFILGCGPAPVPHEAKETALAATARANTGGGQDFGPLAVNTQPPKAESTPTTAPATAPSTPTTAPATATSTETPKQVEIIPVSQIPAKLDALVASVNALPQSFDPDIKTEQFQRDKKEIEAAANAVKDSLAKGDIAEARKNLEDKYRLKIKIIDLGAPLQSKFVPQDIKDKADPQDLIIKKDRVDPRIMEYYLKTVEIYLSIYSAK